MPKLILVDALNECEVRINVNHIVSITQYEDHSDISLINGECISTELKSVDIRNLIDA